MPFYADIPLWSSDPAAEAVRAQPNAFDNVEVRVEVADYPSTTAKLGARDFEWSSPRRSPRPRLRPVDGVPRRFSGNFSGLNDPELDEALDAGRVAEATDERRAAYETAH